METQLTLNPANVRRTIIIDTFRAKKFTKLIIERVTKVIIAGVKLIPLNDNNKPTRITPMKRIVIIIFVLAPRNVESNIRGVKRSKIMNK